MRGIAVPRKINKKWVRTDRTRDSLDIEISLLSDNRSPGERDHRTCGVQK
jgi:hypothetical protein